MLLTHIQAQILNPLKATIITTANGLPDATITALCEDEDGFLWIGTNNGLSRYDGVEFKNYFHQKDTISIPGNDIKGIVALPAHRLLINTSTGLCIFYTLNGTSKNLLIKSSAKAFAFENNFVKAIIDKDFNIWAGTQTCLYKLDTFLHIMQMWRGFTENSISSNLLLYVHDIKELANGDMLLKLQPPNKGLKYFLYTTALNKINDIDDTTATSLNFLNRLFVKDICFKENGDAFFIRYLKDSLYYFNKASQKIINFPMHGITGDKQISYGSNLFTYRKNLLAVSLNDGGIIYWQPDNINKNIFSINEITLQDKQVLTMLPDGSGNLWLGTNNCLIKYSSAIRRLDIVSFPGINDETKERIDLQNIFISPKSIFIGSNGGGFFYNSANSGWKNIMWNEDIRQHSIWSISANNADRFSVATQKGIYQWNINNGTFEAFQWPKDLKWMNGLPITSQYTDSKNITWLGLGMGHGVAAYNNETKKIFIYSDTSRPFFPLRYPVAIAEDEQGNLWMGGINGTGLVKWSRNSNSFSLIPPVYNTNFDNGSITCLYADKKGSIWIGTASGLCAYNIFINQFSKYDVASGLPSNSINSISADATSRLWIATKNGLCCMDIASKKITRFNELYHLQENNMHFVNYDVSSGDLYFLTQHFLYSIIPEELFQPARLQKVFINGATSSGDNLDISKKIFLNYNNNNINISFAGVNLLDGEDNKYFYRLDTSSGKWQSLGSARQVNFSNLSPGNYIFQVKAQTGSGIWGRNSALLLFTVAAPFWKTWWFIVLCIIVVLAVAYLSYYYRVKQLLHIQKVRNTIATDLHDDIGSALTNINILAELTNATTDPKRSKEFLNRISEEVNTSSQSLDDIVWSINSQNDSFEQVAARMRRYAAELFESANIQYQLEFDENLSKKKLQMEQRRDLYLIFKESLNNIYKHASSSAVVIQLFTQQNNFILKITDNGKGFNTTLPTSRNGIKNIIERAKKWKGIAEINSSAEGTIISVHMPIIY